MIGLRHGQWGVELSSGNVAVYGVCTVTGKEYGIPAVPIEGLRKWLAGARIQEALPELSSEDREFLMSGISPEGWVQAGLDKEDEDDGEGEPFGQLDELEDEHLQAIANMKGGNELAQSEAREAQKILDNRAEAAGSRKAELDFRHYWEGRPTSEDRERDQLRDAGRFRG